MSDEKLVREASAIGRAAAANAEKALNMANREARLPPSLMKAKEVLRANIGDRLAFQMRDWLVRRIAWIPLALIVLVTLAGLLGQGSAHQRHHRRWPRP